MSPYDLVNETPETQKDGTFVPSKRSWKRKFSDAFQGLRQSVQHQSSYQVHFIFALAVCVAAFMLDLDIVRWSVLIICIVMVLAGEMINTSIEELAKAVTDKYDLHIARALNIASGAILVLSIGAACVGTLVFTEAILQWIYFYPGLRM